MEVTYIELSLMFAVKSVQFAIFFVILLVYKCDAGNIDKHNENGSLVFINAAKCT